MKLIFLNQNRLRRVVSWMLLALAPFFLTQCKEGDSPGRNSAEPATPPTITQPSTPTPKFRIFRAKLDEGISVVVPVGTTNEELKSLLWFFRTMIRSQQFKEIGITQPTSMQWGKAGYLSGMIDIYRGPKCASENFSDVSAPGPCGKGDHSVAYYQWGLLVDGKFDTNADSASVFTSNGSVKVFDYQDRWRPSQ